MTLSACQPVNAIEDVCFFVFFCALAAVLVYHWRKCHKYNFCRDKRMFVATKVFVATDICRNKHVFVAIKV